MYTPILSQAVDTATVEYVPFGEYQRIAVYADNMRLPTAEIAELQNIFAAGHDDNEFSELYQEETEYHEMMSEVGPEWFFEEF
jgi:hypothetical protein